MDSHGNFYFWIACNTSPWVAVHYDSLPFNLLNFSLSIEAIFLSTFILITQNREAQMDKQRSQLDLQINLLTEQGNTQMLRILRSIADKVGAGFEEDPDMQLMEQATKPERLLDQINRATAGKKLNRQLIGWRLVTGSSISPPINIVNCKRPVRDYFSTLC